MHRFRFLVCIILGLTQVWHDGVHAASTKPSLDDKKFIGLARLRGHSRGPASSWHATSHNKRRHQIAALQTSSTSHLRARKSEKRSAARLHARAKRKLSRLRLQHEAGRCARNRLIWWMKIRGKCQQGFGPESKWDRNKMGGQCGGAFRRCQTGFWSVCCSQPEGPKDMDAFCAKAAKESQVKRNANSKDPACIVQTMIKGVKKDMSAIKNTVELLDKGEDESTTTTILSTTTTIATTTVATIIATTAIATTVVDTTTVVVVNTVAPTTAAPTTAVAPTTAAPTTTMVVPSMAAPSPQVAPLGAAPQIAAVKDTEPQQIVSTDDTFDLAPAPPPQGTIATQKTSAAMRCDQLTELSKQVSKRIANLKAWAKKEGVKDEEDDLDIKPDIKRPTDAGKNLESKDPDLAISLKGVLKIGQKLDKMIAGGKFCTIHSRKRSGDPKRTGKEGKDSDEDDAEEEADDDGKKDEEEDDDRDAADDEKNDEEDDDDGDREAKDKKRKKKSSKKVEEDKDDEDEDDDGDAEDKDSRKKKKKKKHPKHLEKDKDDLENDLAWDPMSDKSETETMSGDDEHEVVGDEDGEKTILNSTALMDLLEFDSDLTLAVDNFETKVHPHGFKWWRYRYEYTIVESFVLAWCIFLMYLLQWLIFGLSSYRSERWHRTGYLKRNYQYANVYFMHHAAIACIMVCAAYFLYVPWGDSNPFNYFAKTLHDVVDDAFRVPFMGYSWLYMILDIQFQLFVMYCLYSLFICCVVDNYIKALQDWKNLDEGTGEVKYQMNAKLYERLLECMANRVKTDESVKQAFVDVKLYHKDLPDLKDKTSTSLTWSPRSTPRTPRDDWEVFKLHVYLTEVLGLSLALLVEVSVITNGMLVSCALLVAVLAHVFELAFMYFLPLFIVIGFGILASGYFISKHYLILSEDMDHDKESKYMTLKLYCRAVQVIIYCIFYSFMRLLLSNDIFSHYPNVYFYSVISLVVVFTLLGYYGGEVLKEAACALAFIPHIGERKFKRRLQATKGWFDCVLCHNCGTTQECLKDCASRKWAGKDQ